MKVLSLKKLGFALLALCFTSLTSEVRGIQSVFDLVDRTLKSSSSHSKPINDHELLLRTSAVQQGIDAISKFVLRASAAINAFPNNDAEFEELLDALTRNFHVEIVIPSGDFIATNPDDLRNLIDMLGAEVQFDSNLTGNFSLESYHKSRHGRRSLQFEVLEYVVQTPKQMQGPALPSTLLIALDQFHIEEIKPDVFKVKKFVATTIENGFIPIGS